MARVFAHAPFLKEIEPSQADNFSLVTVTYKLSAHHCDVEMKCDQGFPKIEAP
jgi:hypothetical protein